MGELMRAKYDWSEDVKKLQMAVMLIYGDSDMIRLDHVVSFYNLLGGWLKDAGWNREHMAKKPSGYFARPHTLRALSVASSCYNGVTFFEWGKFSGELE